MIFGIFLKSFQHKNLTANRLKPPFLIILHLARLQNVEKFKEKKSNSRIVLYYGDGKHNDIIFPLKNSMFYLEQHFQQVESLMCKINFFKSL